jgi:hypothetical protein
MVYSGTLFIGDNGALLCIPTKIGVKFEHSKSRTRGLGRGKERTAGSAAGMERWRASAGPPAAYYDSSAPRGCDAFRQLGTASRVHAPPLGTGMAPPVNLAACNVRTFESVVFAPAAPPALVARFLTEPPASAAAARLGESFAVGWSGAKDHLHLEGTGPLSQGSRGWAGT